MARRPHARIWIFTTLLGLLPCAAQQNTGSFGQTSAPAAPMLFADQFPGSDDGARIINAISACSTHPGCTIDGRNLVGLTAAQTITINLPVTLYLPHGEFTLAGSPGISISSPGVRLQGAGTSSPSSSRTPTVLRTSSSTADIIQVNAPFFHVSGITFRSAVPRTAGAGLNLKAGHVYGDHLRFERTWDGIAIKNPNSGGEFSHIEFGKGASVAGDWNAAIYMGGFARGTAASSEFDDVLITEDAPFADAAIVLDSGVDSPKFTAVDVAQAGHDSITLHVRKTSSAVAPRWVKFTNSYFEAGPTKPAIQIDQTSSLIFTNCYQATSLQGLLINGGSNIVWANGIFINNQQEAVRANSGDFTITGTRFGDSSQAEPNTYDHIFIAPGVSDFHITDNTFASVMGSKALSKYDINISQGQSNRYILLGNDCGNFATACLFDGGSGTHKLIAEPNSSASNFFANGFNPDAPALKHKRFPAPLGGSCPTSSSAGSACTSAVLKWTTPFPDNNYTASCTLTSTTGQPHISGLNKQPSGITLTIASDTSAPADAGADCVAIHD